MWLPFYFSWIAQYSTLTGEQKIEKVALTSVGMDVNGHWSPELSFPQHCQLLVFMLGS